MKKKILDARSKHPNYGTDRLFIFLNRSRGVVHRVIKKFYLQIQKKAKKLFKPEDENFRAMQIPNLTKNLKVVAPNVAWATDFTYIKFQERYYYLATYLDLFTRQILGWNLSDTHDTDFVLGAFKKAVKNAGSYPSICHSDQGSEYRSKAYIEILESCDVKVSMSPKASPWRNGFQESYYRGFKEDLGTVDNLSCLGELVEAISQTINYYNKDRIHSALKMTPAEFSLDFLNKKSSDTKPPAQNKKADVILFHKVAY